MDPKRAEVMRAVAAAFASNGPFFLAWVDPQTGEVRFAAWMATPGFVRPATEAFLRAAQGVPEPPPPKDRTV